MIYLIAGAVIFTQFFSDKSDKSASLFSPFLVHYFLTICTVLVQSRLDNDWTSTGQIVRKYRMFS